MHFSFTDAAGGDFLFVCAAYLSPGTGAFPAGKNRLSHSAGENNIYINRDPDTQIVDPA